MSYYADRGAVPDDWNRYYSRCPSCGQTIHASEGGCGCCKACGSPDADDCERYCDLCLKCISDPEATECRCECEGCGEYVLWCECRPEDPS